ncbi:hypothetical protein [Metallosphaera hakonensis]|nr:hypothetical protein [Metallosphaera hakonensis]AWR99011.2 hypothetical protein DFR87_04130 [Metallosphaera hakonensis JCM 8857 = DSM 7519]
MDNNVVKRNLEDLENQVVVMIRIDGQIMASRNIFQDVLIEGKSGILIHCMKHCIKAGCVAFEVEVISRIPECKKIKLNDVIRVKGVLGISRFPISIYAMREIAKNTGNELLNVATKKLIQKMNMGINNCGELS